MDPSPRALLRIVLPRIPLVFRTALFNALSLSKASSKQDLITEITVAFLRSIMRARRPMRVLQKISTKDPGIKGPTLVAKVTIPSPDDGDHLNDAIKRAIQELGDGSESYTVPSIEAVEAEWIGYKTGVSAKEPRPNLSEPEQYENLMQNVSSSVTTLYFHGGAYFLMDPVTYRDFVSRLAQLTGGRGYSVRYRLAPQHPFPAQLLDGLIAYLSLISPPPGMSHEAVPPRNIVFAGDSAGGNLALALLQLLLTLQRIGMDSIRFHGVDVPIQLPADVAVISPWVDIARSLPSLNTNAHLDYLDPPSATGLSKTEPIPDDLWPASPPRADIFCNASMMVHPLASPLAAAPELWKGMPPIFICLGNESLEDEISVLARRMHQGGGVVDFVLYEGLPHAFPMVFPRSIMGKDCWRRCGEFCSGVVQGLGPSSSRASWAQAFSKPLQFQEVEMKQVSKLSDHEVAEAMKRMQNHAMEREKEALKRWNEQKSKAKL